MRTCRQLFTIAAAFVAAVTGCQSQPSTAAGPRGANSDAALKPVTVEPAPPCDLGAAPASRPRGTVIALYHTANVAGEVEPCG
jgi:hypothetical protein